MFAIVRCLHYFVCFFFSLQKLKFKSRNKVHVPTKRHFWVSYYISYTPHFFYLNTGDIGGVWVTHSFGNIFLMSLRRTCLSFHLRTQPISITGAITRRYWCANSLLHYCCGCCCCWIGWKSRRIWYPKQFDV